MPAKEKVFRLTGRTACRRWVSAPHNPHSHIETVAVYTAGAELASAALCPVHGLGWSSMVRLPQKKERETRCRGTSRRSRDLRGPKAELRRFEIGRIKEHVPGWVSRQRKKPLRVKGKAAVQGSGGARSRGQKGRKAGHTAGILKSGWKDGAVWSVDCHNRGCYMEGASQSLLLEVCWRVDLVRSQRALNRRCDDEAVAGGAEVADVCETNDQAAVYENPPLPVEIALSIRLVREEGLSWIGEEATELIWICSWTRKDIRGDLNALTDCAEERARVNDTCRSFKPNSASLPPRSADSNWGRGEQALVVLAQKGDLIRGEVGPDVWISEEMREGTTEYRSCRREVQWTWYPVS
ncbi:hypothetical protein BKA70DRAFT_1414569 [Coprinopsis sp. MPI-PUGE-AT-0042]|nr:hypothetical protein BKA70DRAFT_1414569 [Coprinopsis sp. MPI-PUGE-AT-0042]